MNCFAWFSPQYITVKRAKESQTVVSLYYRARPARVKIDNDFAVYFISYTGSISSVGQNFMSEEGFKIGKYVIFYNQPIKP